MSALTVQKRRKKPAEKAPRLLKWGVALVDSREQPVFLVAYASDDNGARERLGKRAQILLAQATDAQDRALLKAWIGAFSDSGNRPYWMVAEVGALPRWYPMRLGEP